MAQEPKSEKKPDEESDKSTKEAVTEKTGYEPTELLKAPIKNPEIKEAKKPTDKQYSGYLVGAVLILLGIILWPLATFWVGAVIVLIGVVVASYSVLVRMT